MAKPDTKKPATEGSEQVSPPSPTPADPPKPSPIEAPAAEHVKAMAEEAKPEAPAAKPGLVKVTAPAAPSAATYRVWPFGTLQRNGTTYQPGDTLTMDPVEAAKIPCLERVEP